MPVAVFCCAVLAATVPWTDDMPEQKLIVVTGGAGFLGSVMVPMLLEKGYRVRVVDRFFFGAETLRSASGNIELIEADTRWCPEDIFAGAYAVIDLAALSNDPSGELDPARTQDINFKARVRTATLAKKMGAKRYILASSCSVYGFQDSVADESAVPAPITTYAQSSLNAERGALPLSDDTFAVTALRQGTLYGLSPRMRFDLVVNVMALNLHNDGIITVRGGQQWRPLVHVADSARAFILILEAPHEMVAGEVFNVGGTEHNYVVSDIAEQVRAVAGSGDIVADKTAVDTRSYRVSFEKIKDALGFVPSMKPGDGAREVIGALSDGIVTHDVKTRTIDWYKKLSADDANVLDRVSDSSKRIEL